MGVAAVSVILLLATDTAASSLTSRLNEWSLPAIELDATAVQEQLREHGHLLVHGAFNATRRGLASLQPIALAGHEPMAYVGGAANREEIDGVYETGHEPAHLTLAFHNEMAYLPSAVQIIAFGCVSPAATFGAGRTLIADNREALRQLPIAMARKMELEGVLYEQRLSDGTASGDAPVYKTWQQAFYASTRREVETTLNSRGQEFSWKQDRSLVVRWKRPAFARHPSTGEEFMFHAILSGHTSWYDEWPPWSELEASARPWHSRWGDGTEFSEVELSALRNAYAAASAATAFDWQAGDLLILDNIRFVHGRTAFDGDEQSREIGVMMGGLIEVGTGEDAECAHS